MTNPNHPTTQTEKQLLEHCEIRRTRGSGPGGQHRNKVETAIVITHRPSGVVGQASERRSQNANRLTAIERLRINLALQVRGDLGPDRIPSSLWMSRVRARKIVVSSTHFDFATLLAEAVDFVVSENFEVAEAAERLGVSTSQLIKFFKAEATAFQYLNRERESRQLRRLK